MLKNKDFKKVLDLMQDGCSEYCSIGSCEEASGFNEHFEATVSYYKEAKSWGMYK
jgi:hypothetical protein